MSPPARETFPASKPLLLCTGAVWCIKSKPPLVLHLKRYLEMSGGEGMGCWMGILVTRFPVITV